MITKTLAERLRKLKEGRLWSHTSVEEDAELEACIAQAEAMEKLAYFEARVRPSSDDPEAQAGEGERYTTMKEYTAQMADKFAHELAASQAGELSDFNYNVLKERMIEEHRKYGDKLRFGHWADIAARKVVSHLRDMGYLRPSQAIGEQTPVAWMHENEEVSISAGQKLDDPNWYWNFNIPLYRSPISPEARDMAIEAGNAMRERMVSLSDDFLEGQEEAYVTSQLEGKWDQALSALRGQ